MEHHPGRHICTLPDAVASSVRASHVIGSVQRAVEELVRNAVVHGRATSVVVKVGDGHGEDARALVGNASLIEVQDNGVGIDVDAMRGYIGTEHCSSFSVAYGAADQREGTSGSWVQHAFDHRGESLRALASLCVKMQITSSSVYSLCSIMTDAAYSTGGEHGDRKIRNCADKSFAKGNIVTSKKTIREGVLESFASSLDESAPPSSSVIPVAFQSRSKRFRTGNNDWLSREQGPNGLLSNKTGTTVQIRGLFHRHAVRRRHHEFERSKLGHSSAAINGSTPAEGIHARKMRSHASERADMAQIRASIRMLAMAYPLVSFHLENGRTGTLECGWDTTFANEFTSKYLLHYSHSQADSIAIASALAARCCQVCGDSFNEESFVPVIFEEEISYVQKTSVVKGIRKKMLPARPFRVVGVISRPDTSRGRIHKDQSGIYVNGRLAEKSLCSVVQDAISVCTSDEETGKGTCFFLHITCRGEDVDLIVEETQATMSVRQRDRLESFLLRAVCFTFTQHLHLHVRTRMPSTTSGKAMKEDPGYRNDMHSTSSDAKFRRSVGSRLVTGNCVQSLRKRGQNHVSTEERKTSPSSTRVGVKTKVSPFSDAFFNAPNTQPNFTSKKSPGIAFEDAFLEPSTSTKPKETELYQYPDPGSLDAEADSDGTMWTRTRVRALESQISNVSESACVRNGGKPISLTKDMLSNATVVAQVDSKFIIINARGVLCAVDQHAADERVGLEKLEKSLQSVVSGHLEPGHVINLSKQSSIRACDLLKSVQLLPAESIQLSPSQAATINHHFDLLTKWCFVFDTPSDGHTTLRGVPAVCDKVATSTDFLHFVQALGNRSADAALVKPAFVKRILASQACRYAIMFGDALSHKNCVKLIQSLSECELCFVCAHGRPSVVPLLDTNASTNDTTNSAVTNKTSTYLPLSFQPRFLRAKGATSPS